jgi:hypothetical protein
MGTVGSSSVESSFGGQPLIRDSALGSYITIRAKALIMPTIITQQECGGHLPKLYLLLYLLVPPFCKRPHSTWQEAYYNAKPNQGSRNVVVYALHDRQDSGNDGADQTASYNGGGAAFHRPVLERNAVGVQLWFVALPLLAVLRHWQAGRIVLAEVICSHDIPSITCFGCPGCQRYECQKGEVEPSLDWRGATPVRTTGIPWASAASLRTVSISWPGRAG